MTFVFRIFTLRSTHLFHVLGRTHRLHFHVTERRSRGCWNKWEKKLVAYVERLKVDCRGNLSTTPWRKERSSRFSTKKKYITLLRQLILSLIPTPIRITCNSHIPPLRHSSHFWPRQGPLLEELLFPLIRYNHGTSSNFPNYDWSELSRNSCITCYQHL